jgi:acetate kinase
MDYRGMGSQELTQLLYKESGLLGVSGISQDMRILLESPAPEAREAVDLFCYRIQREIGSLTAALGGVDALVFTGGIGERGAAVREKVCAGLDWLEVRLDGAANASHASQISSAGSRIAVCVIPTNEEWIIARHTARLVD